MAGRIALDLKAFKHLKSDDISTTLQHDDGHTLVIASKALSPDFQKQLKALEQHSKKKPEQSNAVKDKPQKFAYGDEVLSQDEQLADLSTQDMTNPTKINTFTPEEIQSDKEQRLQQEMQSIKGGAIGQDPVLLQKAALNNMGSVRARKDAEMLKASAVAADQKAQQEELNEMRTREGLSPVPTMNDSQQKLADMSKLPEAGDVSNQGGLNQASAQPEQAQQYDDPTLQGGHQKSMAGIDAEAIAKSNLGEVQAGILSKQLDAQAAAMAKYDEQYQALERERQAHMQDIKDGYIDPNKYWTGDPKTGEGSHSKIASAIGMIIAGFAPTATPNAAIAFLNKQMDANLDAQAKNLNSKNNMLAENLKQFGNLKDATMMTKIMQSDIVQNQLLMAAAKATTPLAKAAAMQAKGKLESDNAVAFQKFTGQRTVNALKQQASQDPSKMQAYFAALDAADPTGKLSKEAKELSIPGVGFASSVEGAKGMREMSTTVNTVKQSIARLKEIAKKSGKSMNSSAIAEADTIRNMLIGQLRIPITGPGAMSEGEREILMKTIPDVTAIMSLDSSNLKRLDTLESKVINQYKNQAAANGLNPNNIPGMEVIRRTKDGRNAAYDAATKKFLGYR